MNTFTAGQKVRITEQYGPAKGAPTDGSREKLIGTEGTVIRAEDYYISVRIPLNGWNENTMLFLPEELEAV